MICALVSVWPISVVLLDTTSVLGELGWKTYPINGVRRRTLFFLSFILSTVSLKKKKKRISGTTSTGSINYLGPGKQPVVGFVPVLVGAHLSS